jgi:ribonuclease Z
LAGPVRHEPVEGAVGYRVETPDGVVAISGDTLVCDEVAELSRGADVVVYEATRFEQVLNFPPELHFIVDYHADTKLIGEQMEALGIPTVMLTHLIPPPSTAEEKQGFEDDVREGRYTGRVIVCDDLDGVTLDGAALTGVLG